MSKASRRLARKHRMRLLIKQEKNKPCTDCKIQYPKMEFDHLRNKKFTIGESRTITKSWRIIKEEIEKCEVVCHDCHVKREKKRRLDAGLAQR